MNQGAIYGLHQLPRAPVALQSRCGEPTPLPATASRLGKRKRGQIEPGVGEHSTFSLKVRKRTLAARQDSTFNTDAS